MQTQNLSLTHLIRAPQPASERPPLLLLLHGYGSNERDLFGLASYVDPRFLVIAARAPLLMQPGVYAWFEIAWTATGIEIDREQAAKARDGLIQFIAEAVSAYHTDPARVYLLGFSQGAIMSAAALLHAPQAIAGAALLSGSANAELVTPDLDRNALSGKPVLITHGTNDPVLPIQNGRTSRDLFQQLPVTLTYHEYRMGHEINQQSLADVLQWLRERL